MTNKMNRIYTTLAAMALAACVAMPTKEEDRDVLPTPNFSALEEKVDASTVRNLSEDPVTKALLEGVDYNTPDEKPLPSKTNYVTFTILKGADYSNIKEARVKRAITKDYQGCSVGKVENEKEADIHARAFMNFLLGIANGTEKGELEFYSTNKGQDAVLLRKGDVIYIAVGRKGLKLKDLWYFGSLGNCEAEVFEGAFEQPANKSLSGLVRQVYSRL